ncbi:calcium/sodium antiporter [Candidatus Sumerlaeota bacterium]|nr:calcium/sodium antiporter [Candidatus Sumerlaeota bacterium]
MDGRSTPVLLALIAVCLYVLVKGADWLVEGAASLARRTGMPNIVIGATIVSIGTTTPECFVSVMGAVFGNSGLALGNGVGSIICDTGLILGLVMAISSLHADPYILNRQGRVQVGAAAMLVALCVALRLVQGPEPVLGRIWGALLLVGLCAYIAKSIHWARKRKRQLAAEQANAALAGDLADEIEQIHDMPVVKSLGLLFIGVLMVIVSARVLIPAVATLARRLHVPDDVIAATLVAFGTSLPELVTCLMAVRKGKGDLALGNVIGADVLNVLFVIGAAALARPLTVMDNFFFFHFPAMMTILVLFRIYIHINRGAPFKRWQGITLLSVYGIYILLQYAFGLGN